METAMKARTSRSLTVVVALTVLATVTVLATPAAAARPTCRGQKATIVGTPGNDVIIGTSGPDVIVGLGGKDIIRGRGGNDIICGNGGADRIYGNGGDDIISGGGGNDRLYGKSGSDTIYGGRGRDVLRGAKGQDKLYGNGGKDRLYGGSSGDRLFGGKSSDYLEGGKGDDYLDGGPGADTIRPGDGADFCAEGLFVGCAPTRLGTELRSITSDYCGSARWNTNVRDVNGRIAEHSISCGVRRVGNQGWIEYDLGRGYSTFTTQLGIDDDAISIESRVRFRIYGDGVLLLSRDVGFGEIVPVQLSVRGVLRLRLEVTLIAGPSAIAYPTWAAPVVSSRSGLGTSELPTARPQIRPRLGSEIPTVSTDYCGSARWRVGVRSLNGNIYTDSLSCGTRRVGDSGWADFKLSRAYRTLNTVFGVEDTSTSSNDIFRVRIYGDGRLLLQFDSGFGSTRPVNLNVSGILRLRLEVEKISGDFGTAYPAFSEPLLSS